MDYNCKSISDDVELDGRSRVGIFKDSENYSVITPYGLILPKIINCLEKDKVAYLKKYAKCITKALSKDKMRQLLYANRDSKNNPLSALNVVLDYIQNGPYREYENEIVIREKGKIDFKKTISKVRPEIIKGEILYSKFAVSRKRISSQEIVNIAQGNVINHFMEHGGEVLFGSLIQVTVPRISLDGNLINRLRIEKANSFNSRKQQLIQWMIEYIQGALNKKAVGEWQYSIVASTLWEEMIDACYSNQISRNKTQYGRKFKMYIEGQQKPHTSPSTQHDTVYETEDEIAIIDAKMYQSAILLNTHEVLEKQFGYYMTAKVLNPNKRVYNILIKPYVDGYDAKEGFIAKIPFSEGQLLPYDDNIVLVYSVDFNTVLDAYYSGRKITNDLLIKAKEYLEKEIEQ